jgi:hypothetical protein
MPPPPPEVASNPHHLTIGLFIFLLLFFAWPAIIHHVNQETNCKESDDRWLIEMSAGRAGGWDQIDPDKARVTKVSSEFLAKSFRYKFYIEYVRRDGRSVGVVVTAMGNQHDCINRAIQIY